MVLRAGLGAASAAGLGAATLADFLDPSVMSFAEPPHLAAPANPCPDSSGAIRVSRCRRYAIHGADRLLIDRSHPAPGGRVRYMTLVSGIPPPWEHVERQKGRTKCALRT